MFLLKTSMTERLARGFIPMPEQGFFPPLFKNIEMNRGTGYCVAKLLRLESTLYVILLRFAWRSEVWAGGSGTLRVPSRCSSSLPAARDTFLLEIFSLMALAISSILRNTHTKQMESLLYVTAQGGGGREGNGVLVLQAMKTESPK